MDDAKYDRIGEYLFIFERDNLLRTGEALAWDAG